MKRPISFIIFVAVALYCSIWLFNHINAWIGIAAFVFTLYMVAEYVLHNINKK